MMRQDSEEMKLAELAERSQTPARTIRLYISMGLLPGPLRSGRNAAYGAEHLEQLARIRAMQREGMTLSQLRRRLDVGDDEDAEIASLSWRHYAVAPDVQVMVREDMAPWRARALRRALAQFSREMNAVNTTKERKDE